MKFRINDKVKLCEDLEKDARTQPDYIHNSIRRIVEIQGTNGHIYVDRSFASTYHISGPYSANELVLHSSAAQTKLGRILYK